MRKGKELIGKPIYGVTDGRQIGSVRDLFVDLELELLQGIFLGREGLISRKVQFVASENIAVFGIDAVLATGSDVVSDNSQVPKVDMWLRRDTLTGREVETAGGTKVGTVGDLLFDEGAAVAGVTLARVHVAGPIAESKQVLRSAITDTGGREGVMVIDLAIAEGVTPVEEPAEPIESEPAEPARDDLDIPFDDFDRSDWPKLFLVEGSYDDAFDLTLEAAEAFGWYCRNTGYNPFTAEGKKTAAFEICEQLTMKLEPTGVPDRWLAPDAVFVSVGDGNIISGLHKGFKDLKALGWIERMPRLYGIQSTGSAAISALAWSA